jgi:(2R)-ethylmalonyl-CoA mutase
MTSESLERVRGEVERLSRRLGSQLKILVGKPGLDGHSNGAEQIAVRARDAGMAVVYEGIRLTPTQIVSAAQKEAVHIVGLSILSGSHVALVKEVIDGMRQAGIGHVPLVVGGIIPSDDAEELRRAGVARVYTPKDYDITAIMRDIVGVVGRSNDEAA